MTKFVTVQNSIINLKYVHNIKLTCGFIHIQFDNDNIVVISPKNAKDRDEIMEFLTKECEKYNEEISKKPLTNNQQYDII